MITLLRIRIARRLARVVSGTGDERGMALATVIIFGMVLTLMSGALVASSVSGDTQSQTDANWSAAAQAAYAGVEDYQSKLANDNGYSQYGTTGSTFSGASLFPGGTDGNTAFNLGSGAWQPVDPNNPASGSYRYQVDNTLYSSQGILRLQSTGRVGNTTRTVVANLKQSGFLDYLYFTDDEYTDPSIDSDCPASSTSNAYQWNTSISSSCSIISFASGDTISGPAHSNDTISICGSTFLGKVTTSAPVAKVANGYVVPGTTSCPKGTLPNFNGLGNPTYVPLIQMPATIGSLIQETRNDLTASTVPRPGCLYTGPTTFTFNSNGTWTVYSPWTQYTEIAGDPAVLVGSTQPAACGTPGYSSKGGTLGSPGGQTFTVVPNNLVYVQNVPTTTSDPNYPRAASTAGPGGTAFFKSNLPLNYTCTGADGSTVGNGVGYPAVGETAPTTASYSCKNGDAFVQGVVNGAVTIAANNYVYVTGDITYDTTNKATDLLGLIGQNNVFVYNPATTVAVSYNCTNTLTGTANANGRYTCTTNQLQLMDRTKSSRTIDAAIMSVAHSFTVENYSADGASTSYPTSPGYPKGKLTVLGSIVQKYRGAVATAAIDGSGGVGTGYTKNYLYDPRLANEAPPKFLSPVSTSYGITSMTETKTAFSPTGAPL
ncbi:hypothetical protein AX769_05950 [Frondihabitans sp. PAMC 28766]|uniref:hypothetical protein n=1 Tax=Frondihabitans sp. PAMC 28766 TaxID=1795630 RepID=UPI00078D7B45|nr:hypothetical protein [Frondihabitans sp. PAMC 28766]AMM19776.1 hypothetical protein AX769_05950 [Frondihabitans sp. PAMC 28766]